MIPVSRIAIAWVVFALLLTSSVAGTRVFAAADANADHAIDVLDVQLVGAALLAQTRPDDAADVNGDGRVDVLDFQQVVNEAANASRGGAPSEAPQQTPAPASYELLALKVAASAAIPLPSSAFTTRMDHARAPFAPQHARLQRLGLAAHAPPIA